MKKTTEPSAEKILRNVLFQQLHELVCFFAKAFNKPFDYYIR